MLRQVTRQDFLKDIAFATALAGLTPWVNQLDEPPPVEMMNLASSTCPCAWRAPSELGTVSPAGAVLNRASYGTRPGDFERVQRMGINAYIDEQLHPETIDDSAIEQRVTALYPTLARYRSTRSGWMGLPLLTARTPSFVRNIGMEGA